MVLEVHPPDFNRITVGGVIAGLKQVHLCLAPVADFRRRGLDIISKQIFNFSERLGNCMKWKKEYATGEAEIDRQHQTLFAYVEDFREVLKEGCTPDTYRGALEFLDIYSKTHFGFEEDCMHAHKCPAACKNKKEHSLFLNVVRKETEDFEANGFSNKKAMELMDIIDNWLDSHICRVDIQLKDYLD